MTEHRFIHNSWIEEVTYDDKSMRMVVHCKGNKNVYELENVSLDDFLEFKAAPSRGAHYNAKFRGKAKFAHKWFK